MIKHIVAWNFREDLSQEENLNNAKKIKEDLEALQNKISTVRKIKVDINPLKTGDFDVVLISEFDSAEDLEAYQLHEEHKKVGKLVKASLTGRKCIDYEV